MSKQGLSLAALAALVGCAPQGSVAVGEATQAMEGRIVSAEFALDAPWRLEPEEPEPVLCVPPYCNGGPSYRYGAVPVVVSVRDTLRDTSIRRIYSADVAEIGTSFSRHYELNDFHEIEFTRGEWQPTPGFELPDINHTICKRWQGQDCAGAGLPGVMSQASEWDALLFYDIQQSKVRGKDVRLQVKLNVQARRSVRDPNDPNRYIWQDTDETLDNEVVIHLGEAPLPRFDGRWAYGDLHYHSYGTDNEGEAGYSHRATLHAVSALGMDFVFATEHASDSPQFNLVNADLELVFNSLRDMNPQKFRQLLGRLNQPGGANREILSYVRMRNPWRYSVPQIFLGGEADTFPEVSPAEAQSGLIPYGSKQLYKINTCDAVGSPFNCGGLSELLAPTTTLSGQPRVIVKDQQGITDNRIKLEFFLGALLNIDWLEPEIGRYPARQHLVHLPDDPARGDAFISSGTTRWGGGNRRLEELLDTEYNRARKGVTFLAHPVDIETDREGAEKKGHMRLGPDIVPYSESQLSDAFKNEHMLGLEAWNEDARARTKKESASIIASADGLTPFKDGTTSWEFMPPEPLIYSSLHRGVAAWDRMLRWGIDPSKTSSIGWLPQGRPRRVFFAGGSDAHGDLNYRRAGYMFGVNEVNDTAIGKPRNLVYVGNPAGEPLVQSRRGVLGFGPSSSPFGQRQVVDALRAGQFTATDGPALRVAIDMNNDGKIDDGDIPMGGERTWWVGGVSLPVVVEWISSPEFGPVETVELAVGAHSSALGLGMTFAPTRHGVRMSSRDPQGTAKRAYLRANGTSATKLDDDYWQDPTGTLRFSVSSAEGMKGSRTIVLSPSQFMVGRPVTRLNPPCSPIPQPCPPGLIDCFDPEPEPQCTTTYHYEDERVPDRLYVRAFAKTARTTETRTREVCQIIGPCGKPGAANDPGCEDVEPVCRTETYTVCTHLWGCFPRLAYSNPVWAYRSNPIVAPPPDQILAR